jgi:hypothetical protein
VRNRNTLRALCLILVLILLFSGCTAKTTTKEVSKEVTVVVEKVVTQEVPKEVTRVVEKVVKEEAQPAADIPFAEEWISSPHAKTDAEAFVHWNEEDPPVVPKTCAKCHSTYGYRDFLGADGTPANVVDNDAKIGSVITCVACHNDATMALTSVVFPSGLEVKGLGDEARCMLCHQGRASTKTVDASIEKAKLTDPDTVSGDLGFTNIHYFAAAATQMGTLAMGGYQYQGKAYDARFAHVQGIDTCIDCHDQHTLQLRVQTCSGCHSDVKSKEDIKTIRMQGSLVDYDGDGNTEEGIYAEVEGVRSMLLLAMQAYSKQVAGVTIGYSANTYPYFLVDTNGDGELSQDEAKSDNGYKSFTARLAKAAYNYQTSLKDPGAFAHGGKYIIELLYDSIEDLNAKLSPPVDLTKAHRIDAGHFASSEEAFRHWDEEGMVPASCSRCHTAEGVPLYLRDNTAISRTPSSGLLCSTCHDSLTEFTRYQVKQTTFPSGAVVDSGDPNTNLCMTCHQGRESTTSVNRLIGDIGDDEQSPKLRFLNVHYFAAGATLFGDQAKGAYQYEGKTYLGRNTHVVAYSNCYQCHDVHALTVKVTECSSCHTNVASEEDLASIRMSETDYDGNGDTTEGLAQEIDHLRTRLYAAMQAYATAKAGAAIAYDPISYPYFFVDTNGNKAVDPEEAKSDNGFNSWTPRLLRAAYNYQYTTKDPGAFAHNGKYIIQVIYDSLESLAEETTVDMKGLTRP